jgi:hypothetical protein
VKRLIFVPIIGALIVLAGMGLDANTMAAFLRAVLVAALVATGVSGFATAMKFDAGDRLLKCWMLIGIGYAMAAVRHGSRLLAYFVFDAALPPLLGNVLMVAQNIAIALALLLFVLAWRATGLTAPISRGAQTASIVLGIAVAVVVGGYPLFSALNAASPNLSLFISTAGDIVGFCVIVPLALSALAMRGGLLMHTWIYLAASEVAWLLYDLWWAMQPPLAPNVASAILEALRVMAVLFAFIATVAQRRAMR